MIKAWKGWRRGTLLGVTTLALVAAAQAQDSAAAAGSTWTKETPKGGRFLGFDYTPSCSGVPIEGIDTDTFSFFVKRGDPKKLVVFFEGGGACWDARTCLGLLPDGNTTDPTFTPFIHPAFDPGDPVQVSGIFDTTNADNPLRDWSAVYIPYCTGDIHAGSKEQEIPIGPFSVTVHHRGFDNFLAALQHASKQFSPQRVVVAGSSAGGYGAVVNLPWIRQVFPRARMALISDSAQGVIPNDLNGIRDEEWNFQLAPWLFAGVPRPVSTETIYQRTFAAYPDTKFAQYTTNWDLIQTSFYGIMAASIGQPWQGPLCDYWEERMRSTVITQQSAINYRSYIASGTEHTVLATPRFFAERSAGPRLADWVRSMLQDQSSRMLTGNPDWNNASCSGDCGRPPYCPF